MDFNLDYIMYSDGRTYSLYNQANQSNWIYSHANR